MAGRGVETSGQMVVFERFFPDGKIRAVKADQVPEEAMAFFERSSSLYINFQDYKRGNFSSFFVIEYADNLKTFLAQQTKTYWNGDMEELTHLIDLSREMSKIGHGEIRMALHNRRKYFRNKPFVGYTETNSDMQGQGLGTRRLLVMNALCQMFYGLPLNSSTLVSELAKRRWERLATEGKARMYMEGKKQRFVFT
jgi:hypothetical protein